MAAVVYVLRMLEQDTSSLAVNINGFQECNMIITYKVIFDGADNYAVDAYNATGSGVANDPSGAPQTVPGEGDEIPGTIGTDGTGHPTLYFSRYDTLRESELAIIIKCTFSSNAFSPSQTGKWNVDIKASFATYTESSTRWVSHMAEDGSISNYTATTAPKILNSVYDLYPDGLVREHGDIKFTLSFNTDDVEAASLMALSGHVNSDTVEFTIKTIDYSFEPGTLKMLPATWSTVYTSSTGSYSAFYVEISFIYHSNTWAWSGHDIGWATMLIDKGRRQFLPAATAPPFVKAADGRNFGELNKVTGDATPPLDPITVPIFLDGAGHQNLTGEVKFFPDPSNFTPPAGAPSGLAVGPQFEVACAEFMPALSGIGD